MEKNGHGGARANSGRKSIAEEMRTRDLAKDAIIAKYGTLEKGLKALMDTGEPMLIKFVFEHAFGKPTDEINGKINVQTTVSFKDAS